MECVIQAGPQIHALVDYPVGPELVHSPDSIINIYSLKCYFERVIKLKSTAHNIT